MPDLSRHEFLQRMAQAGAALLLSSVESLRQTQGRPTRVGVIGCSSVSGQYLPHPSKSPYAELISACDIVYERAERRAREYNVPHT